MACACAGLPGVTGDASEQARLHAEIVGADGGAQQSDEDGGLRMGFHCPEEEVDVVGGMHSPYSKEWGRR